MTETETSLHSMEELSNFQVYVRVRPFNNLELYYSNDQHSIDGCPINGEGDAEALIRSEPNMRKYKFNNKKNYEVIKFDDNLVFLFDPENKLADKKEKTFAFNGVFGPTSNNREIFERAFVPNLDIFLRGYNCTFFAYGMTGSGKTHTIFGSPDGQSIDVGVTSLTFDYLLNRIVAESVEGKETIMKVSYLEIYNETVRDLLCENERSLGIKEDLERGGVVVPDLKEFIVNDMQSIENLIRQGNQRRTLAPTLANQFSSRSHAIIQVSLESKDKSKGNFSEEVTSTKLRLIDLAGSERGSNVNIRGGRGLIEGANINKSLLALGNCINILSSDRAKKGNFVPYRDSKLTRLLKDSLGGNTKTVMISCISPSSFCFDETLNTLQYASRARNIKTKIAKTTREVEVHHSRYKEVIASLRNENEFLREMIKQNMGGANSPLSLPPPLALTNNNPNNLPPLPPTAPKLGDLSQWAAKEGKQLTMTDKSDILRTLSGSEYIECNNEESRKIYCDNINRIMGEKSTLLEEIEAFQAKLEKSKALEEEIKMVSKDDYLERICHDLLANFEEKWEIRQSLSEIDDILVQTYTKIANMEKRMEEETDAEIRRELNEELQAGYQQNQENSEIREKLENALEVNNNQKDILKNLFFHLQEEKKREMFEVEIQLRKQKVLYCDLLQQNMEHIRENHTKNKIINEYEQKVNSLVAEISTLKSLKVRSIEKNIVHDSKSDSQVLKPISLNTMSAVHHHNQPHPLGGSLGMTTSEKRVLTPKTTKPKSLASAGGNTFEGGSVMALNLTVGGGKIQPGKKSLGGEQQTQHSNSRRKTFTDNFYKEHSKTTQGKFVEANRSPSEIIGDPAVKIIPTAENMNPKAKRFLYNESFKCQTQTSKSPEIRHNSYGFKMSSISSTNSNHGNQQGSAGGSNELKQMSSFFKQDKKPITLGKISNSRMQTEPLFVISPNKALKETAFGRRHLDSAGQSGPRNKSLNHAQLEIKTKREPAVATIVLFGGEKSKSEAFKAAKNSQKDLFSKSEVPLQDTVPKTHQQTNGAQYKRRSTSQRYSRTDTNCYLETEMSVDGRGGYNPVTESNDPTLLTNGQDSDVAFNSMGGKRSLDREDFRVGNNSVQLREHEIQFHSIAKLNQSRGENPIGGLEHLKGNVFDSQQHVNPLHSFANEEFLSPSNLVTNERVDTLGDITPNMVTLRSKNFNGGQEDGKMIKETTIELNPLKMVYSSSTKNNKKMKIDTDSENKNPLDSDTKNALEVVSDTADQVSSGCDSPIIAKNSRQIYTTAPVVVNTGKIPKKNYEIILQE